MIFDASKEKLLKALKEEEPLNKILKIARVTENQNEQLNVIRESKNWPTRDSRLITVNQNDVIHMLKRIHTDGLKPDEVIHIAEHALSDISIVNTGEYSRALLEYPNLISIESNDFTALAVLMDGYNWSS